MSMGHSVTSGVAKVAAHGVAAQGHGKAQGAGAAAGGFAALLLSLGGEEPRQAAELPAPGEDDQAVLPDAAALVFESTGASTDPGGIPYLLPVVAPQAGAAAPGMPQPMGAVAPAGGSRVACPGDVKQGVVVPPEADDLPGRTDTTPASGEDQPLPRQAALAQRATQQRTQALEVAAQAAKERRGEDVAARLGWQGADHLMAAGAQAPLTLPTGAGDAVSRPLERRAEKTGPRGGQHEAGAVSGPVLPEGARLDVPAAAPDAGLMTEMRVAEQVSHWVSRGVQNAELEIEGLGEGAVSVNIALQGQEARLEFRTDQMQTRQVLEDSMPHLRELLAREGLVLTGVSVGASGFDGAGGRPAQEDRRGGRQAVVLVPATPVGAAGAAARGDVLTGRSVDLFV